MLSAINTKDESLPTINTEVGFSSRGLSSFRAEVSKCAAEDIFPHLAISLGAKSSARLEALENSLFLLAKDLQKTGKSWEVTLKPFITVHPLLSLARNTESASAEKELTQIIRADPVLAKRYLWTVKALEIVNDLAVKWGLFTSAQFQHRKMLEGTVVEAKQLEDFPKLDTLCLLPEVLYLAATPSHPQFPERLRATCVRLVVYVTELLQVLPTLNQDVDFTATPHIKDYLIRASRVAPETLDILEKRAVAARIGFHVLTLPDWWRCRCLQSSHERTNESLRRLLRAMARDYIDLELHLATSSKS